MDAPFAIASGIYLLLFYGSVLLARRAYLTKWMASRAADMTSDPEERRRGHFRFGLRHLLLGMTGFAIILGITSEVSSAYVGLMVLLVFAHAMKSTRSLQRPRKVVIAWLARQWRQARSRYLALALIGGVFAVSLSDALDGVFGHTWLFERLDGRSISRDWSPPLAFLCGSYLTLAHYACTNASRRDGIRLTTAWLANLGLVHLLLVAIAIVRFEAASLLVLTMIARQSGLAIAAGVPLALWLNTLRALTSGDTCTGVAEKKPEK